MLNYTSMSFNTKFGSSCPEDWLLAFEPSEFTIWQINSLARENLLKRRLDTKYDIKNLRYLLKIKQKIHEVRGHDIETMAIVYGFGKLKDSQTM